MFVPGTVPLRSALPEDGWRDVMLLVCRGHGIPAAGLAPERSGSDVVWGTPAHVIKMTAPDWREEIEAERDLLVHAGGEQLAVATAAVVGSGTLSGWPYIVMTRVPGTALSEVWPKLRRDERLALARDLGKMVAGLHAVPPPPDGRWPEFLARQRAGLSERHRDAPGDLCAALESYVEGTPLPPRDPVLLHTEVLDEHVLLERRGGAWHPSGLIDFADGRVGHPFYEFGALVEFIFLGEPGCLRACLEAYGCDPASLDEVLSRELFVWYLLHRFGTLSRLLGRDPAFRAGSLDDVRRRFFDLGPAG